MRADIDEHKLTVTIEDDAEPFDPQWVELPSDEDLSQPLEERSIGGLGLFLALQGVDDFEYKREGERNRSILVIYRPSADQTE